MAWPRRFARLPAWPRLGLFLLTLLALWLPWAIPLYLIWGEGGPLSWLNLGLLYGLFILLLRQWGQRLHRQKQPLKFYGLQFNSQFVQEAGGGWFLGLGLIGVLFASQWGLGWVEFQGFPADFLKIVLEGLLTGLGVGFAEELFFRGWLQQELELDYHPNAAVLLQALVFAGLHFIRPLDVILATAPQFLGLVLLGCSLGWAKQAWGRRLGMTMGLHGGLVTGYYWGNVGGVFKANPGIPEGWTGVGGNPLAGLIGLVLLGCLAGVMGYRAATAP